MTAEALHALFLACGPLIALATLEALVAVESAGNPYAVNINGPIEPRTPPTSTFAAAEVAHAGLRAGYSVDLGLMQVNSNHLREFNVTIEELLDPCTNLRVGSQLLADAYERAVRVHGEGQVALRAALSAYNTGSLRRGLKSGYVQRLSAVAAGREPRRVPALSPYTATTAVFTRSTSQKENQNAEQEQK